jgi:calcium/calmodulin-dependent protein kinase (CaM kinase) II
MTDDQTSAPSLPDRDREILAINQTMLENVLRGDWQAYAASCSSDVSCFEAETNGILVEGLPFHRFYFAKSESSTTSQPADAQVTMARPHVRWLSDDIVVLSYTRLVQRQSNGEFSTSSCCETRIWQRRLNRWQQVHIHRS